MSNPATVDVPADELAAAHRENQELQDQVAMLEARLAATQRRTAPLIETTRGLVSARLGEGPLDTAIRADLDRMSEEVRLARETAYEAIQARKDAERAISDSETARVVGEAKKAISDADTARKVAAAQVATARRQVAAMKADRDRERRLRLVAQRSLDGAIDALHGSKTDDLPEGEDPAAAMLRRLRGNVDRAIARQANAAEAELAGAVERNLGAVSRHATTSSAAGTSGR